MATEIQTTPAFSAFQSQLKTLCLKEFPCGTGTWLQSIPATQLKRTDKSEKKRNVQNTDKVDSRFSITLKEFGAQHEKTETLEEYVSSKKSPWHLDYSWSEEARNLREIAVKSPWLIDDKFVLNYFKTLRIVNKDVTEVDPDLLQFNNLEELTLSCNLISTLNSRNLPSNLKVLEVCANEISDLSSLCDKPPRLIHLGLGFNRISFIGDYLTGGYWPCLLSLDLSNNNLSDLLDVVNKVGSLPKLRNLVLQGNPLSLIPGYRGYTVDSLRKLNILDDIMISADERHYFKGLSRRREHILDESKVKLSVSYIKGIPQPDELKNPEDQPEFPVVERKYFVQFMFLEDSTLKTEGLHISNDEAMTEMGDLSLPPTDRTDGLGLHTELAEGGDLSAIEKNVNFTAEPDVLHTIEQQVENSSHVETTSSPCGEEKKKEEPAEERVIKTAAVDSARYPWGEEIECNWSQMVLRDDLLSLRDFFKQGMQFSVVEEVVLCYPVIPEEPEDGSFPNPKRRKSSQQRGSRQNSRLSSFSSRTSDKVLGYQPDDSSPHPQGKNEAKDKKEKKEQKDNKGKGRIKSGGKERGGDDKKKKKKEPEQELKRGPPSFNTLATWTVPLAEFLEGEFEYQSVFTQGRVEVASTIRSLDTEPGRKGSRSRGSARAGSRNSRRDGQGSARRASRSARSDSSQSQNDESKGKRKSKKGKDNKKGDAKDKPKKPPSAKKKDESKDRSKDRKASAAKPPKDAKGGDKGKGAKPAPATVDEDEDPGPPPPLEVHINVKLHHWRTAMDLLKDEEEKNRAEEKQPEPVEIVAPTEKPEKGKK